MNTAEENPLIELDAVATTGWSLKTKIIIAVTVIVAIILLYFIIRYFLSDKASSNKQDDVESVSDDWDLEEEIEKLKRKQDLILKTLST